MEILLGELLCGILTELDDGRLMELLLDLPLDWIITGSYASWLI
jgi:hypothetical protein